MPDPLHLPPPVAPGGRYTLVLLPGDGIGPEVTAAARRVIEAAGVKADWIVAAAGGDALAREGCLLPDKTLDLIRRHKVALKGPLMTPVGTGHASVSVQLRKKLDLYAAVRPVRSLAGVKTRYENVELVIFRENTEGLYSGIEHEVVPGVVESLKIASERACTRIAEFAFAYARERQRKKVTVFHKANIMKLSDGLFLRCARAVHERGFGGIAYQELIIDNGCLQLVRDPSQFDVLLLDNYNGDIISDLCAGLVGGLGLVPGANFGSECAIFEAVHGTAPDLAGQNIANPLAAIMSGVMLLNHLGERTAAERIKAAYNAALASGRPEERTRDIGGTAGTTQFTDAIIGRL